MGMSDWALPQSLGGPGRPFGRDIPLRLREPGKRVNRQRRGDGQHPEAKLQAQASAPADHVLTSLDRWSTVVGEDRDAPVGLAASGAKHSCKLASRSRQAARRVATTRCKPPLSPCFSCWNIVTCPSGLELVFRCRGRREGACLSNPTLRGPYAIKKRLRNKNWILSVTDSKTLSGDNYP